MARADKPRLLRAVQPQTVSVTKLNLSVLICKMGVVISSPEPLGGVRFQHVHEVFIMLSGT